MTDAYLSSQCEIQEIAGRGKGIVATTTIPAMSLLAKDTILTDNITFPLTVRIKPFPCTKTKSKTKSQSQSQSKKKQQQQIVEVTGLTRETLHEYAFANGSTYAIYPIIQLVNHGEGFGQINACVFSDPVTKTAYLISITEVQAGTEILFSYFYGYEGMYRRGMLGFLGGKKYVLGNYRTSIPKPRFTAHFESSPWFEFIQESQAFIASYSNYTTWKDTKTICDQFHTILENPQFKRSKTFAKHICWSQFYVLLQIYYNVATKHHYYFKPFCDSICNLLFERSQQLSLPILLCYCKLMDIFMDMNHKKNNRLISTLLYELTKRFPSISTLKVYPSCIMNYPFSEIQQQEQQSKEDQRTFTWQQEQTQQQKQQQDLQLSQTIGRLGLLGLESLGSISTFLRR